MGKTPSKKWDAQDRKNWLGEQKIQRSYFVDVICKLDTFASDFELINYGKLSHDESKYPLYALKSKHFDKNKKNILITGGVHGYETSGVHGVLEFLQNDAASYNKDFNLVLIPCVSPWGYETINRWNPNALDPNRSFTKDSACEESKYLMAFINSLDLEFTLHVDLHETTDTDNTVFRPALAAREGKHFDEWEIPDGFYLVGDVHKPEFDFQQSIIKEVKKVTPIAPCDESNKIIGEDITQEGVINYATKELGLCAGMTNAPYCTTTEVYPDSPKVSAQNCIDAQVVVIKSALKYVSKM